MFLFSLSLARVFSSNLFPRVRPQVSVRIELLAALTQDAFWSRDERKMDVTCSFISSSYLYCIGPSAHEAVKMSIR